MDNVDVLIKKFDEFAKETRHELETIKRGIYGDPKNKVLGLIERQDNDEQRMDESDKRMTKIENKQYKIGLLLAGILMGVDVIWNFIKQNFLK